MPLYQFRCLAGHVFDRFLRLDHYNDPQLCEHCQQPATRQITPTMIAPSFEDYQSPIDGKPITSKKKRIEDLARSGCVPYEPTLRQEIDHNLKNQETALEKAMDRTVESQYEAMTTRQREQLGKELQAGADITYHRGSP